MTRNQYSLFVQLPSQMVLLAWGWVEHLKQIQFPSASSVVLESPLSVSQAFSVPLFALLYFVSLFSLCFSSSSCVIFLTLCCFVSFPLLSFVVEWMSVLLTAHQTFWAVRSTPMTSDRKKEILKGRKPNIMSPEIPYLLFHLFFVTSIIWCITQRS